MKPTEGPTPFHTKTEKGLVPFSQSLDLAKKFHTEHRNEIIEGELDRHQTIRKALDKIPQELKIRFYGHGITRNTETEQLAAFLNILENNTVKGDFGRIGDPHGQVGAWTSGHLLIVSPVDAFLGIKKEDGFNIVRNEIGWTANIGAYVVGGKYYAILDELRKLYPGKNIIRADQLGEYMKEVASKAGNV